MQFGQLSHFSDGARALNNKTVDEYIGEIDSDCGDQIDRTEKIDKSV